MTGSELLLALETGLIYGLVATGVWITFRVVDFPDMTCDGSFVLGAAVCATALRQGLSCPGAIMLAMTAGSLAGALTGALHTRCHIQDLVSGIIVAFMLYSVNLRVMGQPNLTVGGEPLSFPVLAGITGLLLAATGLGLSTDWGLALRSMGQNRALAAAQGIAVSRMLGTGVMLGNALIAGGGALLVQHQGFADVSMGPGTLAMALAAVITGETLNPFRSVFASLIACVGGAILWRILAAVALDLNLPGLEPGDLNLITGIMLAVLMMVRSPGQRRRYAAS